MAYLPINAVLNSFSSTATKTIANTTAETSAIAAGTGSATIKANSLAVGNTIKIRGGGVYGTKAITPGTCTVRVKLGGSTVASCTVAALVGSISALSFNFNCMVAVRAIGASGSVIPIGGLDFAVTTSSRLFGDLTNSGTATTVDTTADLALDVTVQWQTADALNTASVTLSQITIS